jgi:hypothetical protein
MGDVIEFDKKAKYEAVKQLIRFSLDSTMKDEEGAYLDPTQTVTVLQFECHYCHKQTVVNPNDPAEGEKVANMLKVQTADGAAYAFCGVDCGRPGLNYFKKHPLVATGATGGFEAQPATGIVLTDAEQAVSDAVDGEFNA